MNTTSTRSQPAGCIGAASVAPRPQTQVEALLSELNGALDGLDKTIAIHTEKLGPVLRQTDPTPCSDKAQPEETLVERADFLRRMLRRVRMFDSAIESLTDRTEA